MSNLIIKKLSSEECLAISQQTFQVYLQQYNFDYEAILALVKEKFKHITFAGFHQNILSSTITVFPFLSGNAFPSSVLFDFEIDGLIPDGVKVIELGRLAKFSSETNLKDSLLETFWLLHSAWEYSVDNKVEYWVATLHPIVRILIQKHLGFELRIIQSGIPVFSKEKQKIANSMGTYYSKGLDFVYISINEINIAVKRNLKNRLL